MPDEDTEDAGRWSEVRLAELIAALSPPPDAWIRAAQELPAARRSLDELVATAKADASARADLLAGLEHALEAEGYEPDPSLKAILRARLEEPIVEEGP